MSKLSHTVGSKLVATLALPLASVVAISTAAPANATPTQAVTAEAVPPVHVAAQPLDKPVHAAFMNTVFCMGPIFTVNQWVDDIVSGQLRLGKCSGRSSRVLQGIPERHA